MRKCYENIVNVTLLIIMNYYKFISSKYHGIYIYKFFFKREKVCGNDRCNVVWPEDRKQSIYIFLEKYVYSIILYKIEYKWEKEECFTCFYRLYKKNSGQLAVSNRTHTHLSPYGLRASHNFITKINVTLRIAPFFFSLQNFTIHRTF